MPTRVIPDNYVEGVERHRRRLTRDQRSLPLLHTIDPGFVNHRLVHTVLGDAATELINHGIERLPQMADWQKKIQIDHVYKDVALAFCEVNKLPTLGELVNQGRGHVFCSTDPWGPCPNIYEDGVTRLTTAWRPYASIDLNVELHFSPGHVSSDTLRSELAQGAELSVIAHFHRKQENTLIFHPLVIGNPWLRSEDPQWAAAVMFWGRNFFEHFVEDFDEFSKTRDLTEPNDPAPMKKISEAAFKKCIASILGDQAASDWGGETSDYFTAHLNLDGRRVTAAFMFKGPSRFSPMTLNHLGKNNDQIYRLAMEPVDVLFLQHCHDVRPEVRATLRAFAVQPSRPRRYCIIDGRDSLRLLQAYGMLEKALRWSSSSKAKKPKK